MPLSPQQRRRHTPHATAGNHALANADQNLTEVDTRLTRVDRGCQNLTPSTPAPFRRTPNKPEQIRTNLNKPERRQAPRPDRTAPRIALQHPEKKQTRTPPPPTLCHSCAPLCHSCAALPVIPAPPSVIPAPPSPSFLRRPPRHSCAALPPSFLHPLPSFLRRQEPTLPTLAKPCHRQPPPHSGAPRTTLNKSEQTRTNLNAAKRPDQIGSPPNRPQHPEKNKPEHRRRPPSAIPTPPTLRHSHASLPVIPASPFSSFLRRQEPTQHPRPSPIHPSPLSGGRLGGGWEAAIVLPRSLCHPHTRAHDPSFAPLPVIPAQAGTRRSPAFGARLNISTARPSRLCAAAGCSAPGRAPPTA